MRKALASALTELFGADDSVYLLTADTGFHVFDEFQKQFPDRYLNVGVAEAAMVSLAAGLAREGKQVFVYGIVPFVTLRCYEQIRNDLCYPNLPVKIVGVGGGLTYGPAGMSHHAVEDLAVMRALPNMTVVCPGDPVETKEAAKASMRLAGPCYLRVGKTGEEVIHTGGLKGFRIGKGIRLRKGRDVALIAAGPILATARDVCDRLRESKVQATLVSMHTVKPLDGELIAELASQCRLLATVEEHGPIGGLGSAVAEVLADAGACVRLKRFALPDAYCHHAGSQQFLRESCGLGADQITQELLAELRPPS